MELTAEAKDDEDEDEADADDGVGRRRTGLGWTGDFCRPIVCSPPLRFVYAVRCFWKGGSLRVIVIVFQLGYRFLLIIVLWFGCLSAAFKADGLILSVLVIPGDRFQGTSLTMCWYLCLFSVRIDVLILPCSVATLLATLSLLWTPIIRRLADPSSGVSDGHPSGLSAFAVCLESPLLGANTNMSVGGDFSGFLAPGIQSLLWFLTCLMMYGILNVVLLLFVNEIA